MRLRQLNIGCFGGGTGLPSLLGGLKQNPWLHLNAVVKEFRLSTGESYRNVPIDNKRQDDDDYDPCASSTSVVDVNIDGWTVGDWFAQPTTSTYTRGNSLGTDLNRQMPTIGSMGESRVNHANRFG